MRRPALVLAACAALTACGGSDDGKTPPAQVTPAATEHFAQGCAVVDGKSLAPKSVTLPKPKLSLDAAKTYVATVATNCGTFEITLDARRAPLTGGSFKYLADHRFFDGTTIHRIVPEFVIQGGDPKGTGEGGPGYTITEKPPKSLKYSEGVVAMAKSQDQPAGTSGSQFFVATGPDAAKLPPDYALLGKVTAGEDVVARIGAIVTDPRTDRPDEPILLKSVRVTEK
ncbi:peptidylprolyl isomerase [Candidatus Solirubrobacter pratensis]|uniref:peptidylprolyl isomerase n=1 Tax=Candidatus Solirubrobacter pratensis TaxID=1298857 RepID=UPI000420894F|nr:peptidylprolyl isomerase [Candidatus Solirubrobacter pratensis]